MATENPLANKQLPVKYDTSNTGITSQKYLQLTTVVGLA
jgi:hypothetical protein